MLCLCLLFQFSCSWGIRHGFPSLLTMEPLLGLWTCSHGFYYICTCIMTCKSVVPLSFRPKYLKASRNFQLDQHANLDLKISSPPHPAPPESLVTPKLQYQFSHTSQELKDILRLSLSLSPHIRLGARFCRFFLFCLSKSNPSLPTQLFCLHVSWE